MDSNLHDCLRKAMLNAIDNSFTSEETKQQFQLSFNGLINEQDIKEELMPFLWDKTCPLNFIPLDDPHKHVVESIKQWFIDITLTPEELVELKKAVSDIKKEMTDLKPR